MLCGLRPANDNFDKYDHEPYHHQRPEHAEHADYNDDRDRDHRVINIDHDDDELPMPGVRDGRGPVRLRRLRVLRIQHRLNFPEWRWLPLHRKSRWRDSHRNLPQRELVGHDPDRFR
jgi:hypothetical protein